MSDNKNKVTSKIQLTDEDREIIANLELIQNMELLQNMNQLETIDSTNSNQMDQNQEKKR